MPRRILLLAFLAASLARTLPGQVIVLPGKGSSTDRGFSGFASAPISGTTVLHSYMQSADSGAVLGFALAIRGTPQWYNSRVSFHTLPIDSLPPGAVGQRWTVGALTYRLIYSAASKTLTVFDTTIALDSSRVVLVSLPTRADERPQIKIGNAVAVSMREPTEFPPLFLPKASDVRAFAGLP